MIALLENARNWRLLFIGLLAGIFVAHAFCLGTFFFLLVAAPEIFTYAHDLGVSIWAYAAGLCRGWL